MLECCRKDETRSEKRLRGELGQWKETGGRWSGKQKTNVIKLIRFVGGAASGRSGVARECLFSSTKSIRIAENGRLVGNVT